MRHFICVTFATMLLALCGTASADVIVDTGQSDASSALILSATPPAGSDWTHSYWAAEFHLSAETSVTDIQASMWARTSGQVTSTLYDASGGLPGVSPGLFSTTYEIQSDACCVATWHGASGLDWVVGPGDYWITFEPQAGSTFRGSLVLWPPVPLDHYAMNIRGNWEIDPQGDTGADTFGLRVLGSVPEPETWGLMLLGFAGIGFALRRGRAALV